MKQGIDNTPLTGLLEDLVRGVARRYDPVVADADVPAFVTV